MQYINIAVELKLQHDSHGAPQKVGVHAQPFRMHYVWVTFNPDTPGTVKSFMSFGPSNRILHSAALCKTGLRLLVIENKFSRVAGQSWQGSNALWAGSPSQVGCHARSA